MNSKKLNSRLLFVISFCITVLAIYLFKPGVSGSLLKVDHGFLQNIFFINITFLGSGIFCGCLILFLFYIKKNNIAMLLAASFIITALIVQCIKIYLHNNGTQLFFEDENYLIDPMPQAGMKEFISSHTALAFSIATSLSLYFKDRKNIAVVLFAFAGLVAYSRIYFGHHTIADLFAGAFAGIASATISYYFIYNFKIDKPHFLLTEKFNNPGLQ